MKKRNYKNWEILDFKSNLDYKNILNSIENKLYENFKILKDNKRSLVSLSIINNEKIIFKNPRDKNNNSWIRFLTLFRNSESLAMALSMEKLLKNNIMTQTPLMVLEKKKYGMVLDSWIIYGFVEGRECKSSEYHLILESLEEIHKLGLCHGDAHLPNFLFNEKEMVLIDCKPKKKTFGKISEKFEFISMKYSYFENLDDKKKMLDDLSPYLKGVSYHIANLYWNWMELFRKIKKIIRRGKGYENR